MQGCRGFTQLVSPSALNQGGKDREAGLQKGPRSWGMGSDCANAKRIRTVQKAEVANPQRLFRKVNRYAKSTLPTSTGIIFYRLGDHHLFRLSRPLLSAKEIFGRSSKREPRSRCNHFQCFWAFLRGDGGFCRVCYLERILRRDKKSANGGQSGPWIFFTVPEHFLSLLME